MTIFTCILRRHEVQTSSCIIEKSALKRLFIQAIIEIVASTSQNNLILDTNIQRHTPILYQNSLVITVNKKCNRSMYTMLIYTKFILWKKKRNENGVHCICNMCIAYGITVGFTASLESETLKTFKLEETIQLLISADWIQKWKQNDQKKQDRSVQWHLILQKFCWKCKCHQFQLPKLNEFFIFKWIISNCLLKRNTKCLAIDQIKNHSKLFSFSLIRSLFKA